MFRKRAGRHDKKIFSHTASMVHKKNLNLNPMRGGIRM